MVEQLELKRESTVKDFLEVVFRRKWIIVGIVLIAMLIVIVLALRQPAIYESAAKVLIKRGETPSVYDRNVRTLNWEEEIASQIEMAKSQTVIDRAEQIVQKFFPAGYATKRKIQMARANSGVVTTSNVIWVTYASEDPVFCEAAVNAIVTAYKEYYSNTKTPPEMEDFFSEELQRVKDEMEYWREHKEAVIRDGNVVDLKEQGHNLLLRIATYESELDDIVRERTEREAIVNRLEGLLVGGPIGASAVSSDLTGSQLEVDMTRDLRTRYQSLKMQESEMASRYTDRNEELVRVRKQIADLERMIMSEAQTQLLVNKSKLEIVIQRETTLREIIARLDREKGSYPAKEVELERIDVALDKLQKTYSDLMEQYESAKISRASNPEWTVTILNPASPAVRKKTRDYVRIALGPAFSLIIALGLAFFVDNLDHSIKNISEAEETLGLSVLASFPETNRK